MKSKNLIVFSKISKIAQKIYLRSFIKIYAFDNIFRSKTNNIQIISRELKTLKGYHKNGHESAVLGDSVYKQFVPKKYLSTLTQIGGEVYAENITKRNLLISIEKILRNINLAKKAKKEMGIKGELLVSPDTNLDYQLYQYLKKANAITSDINLTKMSLLKSFLTSRTKSLLAFLYILMLPLKFFLKTNFFTLSNSQQRHFKVGGLAVKGVLFDTQPFSLDFFLDNTYLDFNKNLREKDVIYIIPEFPLSQKTLDSLPSDKYEFVDFFNNLFKRISWFTFLKKYFSKYYRFHVPVAFSALQMPYFSFESIRVFEKYLQWDLFGVLFKVDNIFCIQHPFDLTTTIMNQRNGSKVTFIYHGTTTNRIDRQKNPHIAEEIYYSHLLFDNLVAPKKSCDWFKSNQNSISHYFPLGPLLSDVVFKISNTDLKNKYIEQIGIPRDHKIISLCGQTTGEAGIFTYDDSAQFYEDALKLVQEHEDYFLIIKPKRENTISYHQNHHPEMMNRILNHPRIKVSYEKDHNTYIIMGISDLVISAPISSILAETWVGGGKGIIFDPTNKYNQPWLITESMPNLSAHNYNQLNKLVQFWLNATIEECHSFRDSYIKTNYNEFCDGKLIERFRDQLFLS